MSRSYKKHPFYTDRPNGAKFWKRQSNRRIRHYKGDLYNKCYHRLYNSWDIHDFKDRWSKEEALVSYRTKYSLWKEYKNEKDFLARYWSKFYRRK